MTTNPYRDSCPDGERRLPPPSRADVRPQYVHHLATVPPPEISHSIPTHKDVKQRCIKFTVAAVICLLLLMLVTGILLAYYFSSSCIHGLQCGDGGCVWESQWCDGVKDCPAGQDEANCVRLYGSSFLLQMYSTQTKAWRPVCSQGWSDQQGRASCHAAGYSRGTYYKSGTQKTEPGDGFFIMKSDLNPEAFILHQLVLSNSCPYNSVVTLHCTDCGSGVNSSRVSRGQQAPLGSWPWQVSLQVSGSHRCGGAIISPYWIVTGAHCVVRVSSAADWAVYAGIVDPLDSLFHPALSVSHVIAHEGYDRLTRRNDIALMKLATALDVTGSSNIGPVCLPPVGLNLTAPHRAWITQFAHTANDNSVSLHLTEAEVSVIDADECNSSVFYNGRISHDMLCAREMATGGDVCHTDSGGPLVSLIDGLWWLTGDCIWGENCSEQNKPGVYGNVTYFLDWIYSQMKKHQYD